MGTTAEIDIEHEDYPVMIEVAGQDVEISVYVNTSREIELNEWFDESDCILAHGTEDLLGYMEPDEVFDWMMDNITLTDDRMKAILSKLEGEEV